MEHINDLSIPLGNLIQENMSQGILLEEGCSADIFGNNIIKNVKANIALGGWNSGLTKIKFNNIAKSKEEGIFVVEGGSRLMIMANDISGNKDGVVLLRSDGLVQSNDIRENERCGILTVSESTGVIDNNVIVDNKYGLDIEDTALPELKSNAVEGNTY